jgi:hypothetical protein
MKPRISIAMATFNGERYLREQLDSLASQTHLPHELVVGDDGSTDGTLVILEEFARTAPFPMRVTVNPTNFGFADNFLTTASRCEGDWIAFCDQDDIWLSHRLADAAAAIGEGPDDLVLVLQTARLVDRDLVERERIFPTRPHRKRIGKGKSSGIWVWPGFCQTVRADLTREIPWRERPPLGSHPRVGHDRWICLLANVLGTTTCVKRPAMLYRRHDAALTGGYDRPSLKVALSTSRSVGVVQYAIFVRLARDSAARLEALACLPGQEDRATRFREGARWFRKLAEIQALRAGLYAAGPRAARLRCHLRIWRLGGYVGPAFHAMGLRSAIKDAYFTLLADPPQTHAQETGNG